MRRSLKNTLTIPITLAFLVLGAVTFWLVEGQIRSRLEAEFDLALQARAQSLVSLTSFEEADPEEGQDAPFVEFEFEPEFMPEFEGDFDQELDDEEEDEELEEDEEEEEEAQAAFFQLWMADHEFARSGSLGEAELPRYIGEGDLVIGDLELPNGEDGRLLTRRFVPFMDEEWGEDPTQRSINMVERYPGLEAPLMTLSVAVSRESLDDTLEFIAAVLGIGMLALMIAIGGLIRVSVTRGLKPLNELVGQLGVIHSDKLDSRLGTEGLPEEVEPLATTMNSLLDRLEMSFQKERQFSRNIAHELRTPIAELRSIGEVGERWPDNPEANQQFFGDILQIGNRMDLMVTNLLTMARQESGQIECAWENLDLTSAIRGVGGRFRGECEERNILLNLRGPDPTLVLADRVYLDIIATNLLSNAIHHGHNQVNVEVFRNGSSAGFLVENPAETLSNEDLPYLFDRFWRKDTARTSGRHAGLGLALVKSLSEVCDWSVDAELTRNKQFRIQVGGIRHL